MATLLDTSIIELVLPIASIILICGIMFAILQKTKILGDSLNINAGISFVLALLLAVTPGALDLIRFITPWFVVLVVIAFAFLLIFLFMGVDTEHILDIAKNPIFHWTIIILGVIIIISGLTGVFGPLFGQPTGEGEGVGREIQSSIFNVKILGLALILLIASQAIRLISSDIKK